MRRALCFALAALLSSILVGCAFSAGAEELYRLPALPAEYASLEARLDELQAAGAEHIAPASGSNLQSVQMIDLDGDGTEEAIAFFRRATDERALKVYVFRAVEDRYEQLALIEAAAGSIYSVSYADMDGDGVRELLIGWRTMAEVQTLGVYALRGDGAELMYSSPYLRYAARDLDGDGVTELTVVRSDADGMCCADWCAWDGSQLALRSSCGLSVTAGELNRLAGGTLAGGESALFITGVTSSGYAVTDVLALRSGELCSVSRSEETGRSDLISRFLEQYPADIDGDGATEVPLAVAFPTDAADDEVFCALYWRRCAIDGESELACRTFSESRDGWTLRIPDSWDGGIRVTRNEGESECSVTFSLRTENDRTAFLTISAITGESREFAAVRGGRFVLARQVDTIYAACIHDAELAAALEIDEQDLRGRFSLISLEWSAGEN